MRITALGFGKSSEHTTEGTRVKARVHPDLARRAHGIRRLSLPPPGPGEWYAVRFRTAYPSPLRVVAASAEADELAGLADADPLHVQVPRRLRGNRSAHGWSNFEPVELVADDRTS